MTVNLPLANPLTTLPLQTILNFMEEKEAFEYIKNQESSLLILYTLRSNHRYYFIKIGEKILQIITNNDYELYNLKAFSNIFSLYNILYTPHINQDISSSVL
mgnify:CR=1 FL=1